MKKVYLDNAATTAIRPEVVEEMKNVLETNFGNPSSTHSQGRSAKNSVEMARKSVAKLLNATASEIIFSSGATESINWILKATVKDLGVTTIITTKTEHHAVLETLKSIEKDYNTNLIFLKTFGNGAINFTELVESLTLHNNCLVCLMHVNNEIGTILDVEKVALLCKEHTALFFSDTVQSMGKHTLDLQKTDLDFCVASAHKFHGPKGIGFAFIRKKHLLQPLFFGGDQEKGVRAGTEPVHQIAGLTKALEISYSNLKEERKHLEIIKEYAITSLKKAFPEVYIINEENGFYNLVNVILPFPKEITSLLLFSLDMKGIAASRGSACQSGSQKPSHVLAEILEENQIQKPNLRLSFSYTTTKSDVDYLINVLEEIKPQLKI